MAVTDQDTADFARIEAMFGDRNSFINALPEPERVSALGYIDGTEDAKESEDRRMWMANAHLLAKTFKVPVQDVADDYDRLQMAYVAQVLQQEPRDMAPAEFHGLVKQRIDRRKSQRGNLDKLMDGLSEDFISEQKPDFDAAMSRRLAEIDPDGTQLDGETRALFRDAAARQWFKMSESDLVTGEAIAAATDYFVKGRDVSYTGLSADQQRAVNALSKLDENDQRFAIARAASLAKTPKAADGSEPSFLAKLNKLTGRSIGDVARSAVASGVEAGIDAIRYNPAVQGEATKTGKTVPTAERFYQRMEESGLAGLSPRRMEIERKLSDALAGKSDPVNTGGWASTSLLLAGSNLPRMAIAMNPVGLVVNAAAYSKELEGELRDRGVPADRAKILGRIGSPVMAGIDFAQSGIAFKGWLPGGGTLVSKFANQVAKFAVVGGIEAAEQVGQEMAQDAVAPILQSMASAVDEQTPGINFGEEWSALWSKTPTTALAMLPYVLVGTGRNRWKDAHAEKLFLAQRDYVQALGFGKDVQKAVLDAPNAEAISEILTENWDARDMTTPEAQAAQQKLGDKAKSINLSDGGASLLTPQEIMTAEAQAAGVNEGLDFRFTDNGIEILDAGGGVVAVAGNASEAAIIAARYQKNTAALSEASQWAESMNPLPSDTQVTVFAPTTRVGEDGFTRDIPGAVQLDFFEQDPATGEKVNTRSLSMEQATEEGYAVPAVAKSMQSGTYSLEQVQSAAAPGQPTVVSSTFEAEGAPFRLVQAEIDAMRATFPGFNMDELPKPERQSVASWLEAAKRPDANGVAMVDKADTLAAGLAIKPRSITPQEQAAMVLRAAQLKNIHDSYMSDAAALFGQGEFARAQEEFAKADNVAEKFDAVTRAANLSGTEAGRALASRRWLAVDLKTYDLVAMVNRIQAATGKPIDTETKAKLKELTDQNKELQEKIDALEAREKARTEEQVADDAETFVDEAKAGNKPATRRGKRKGGKKAKELNREELLAQLTELGFDPVKGGEVTPAVADVIAKLGQFHVEAGAKTLSDVDGRIKEDVPALNEDVIHQAFSGKIAEDAQPKKELNKQLKEFKKQAGLWSDIHAILESGEVDGGKAGAQRTEKVAQLQEIIAKLRANALKGERDEAKLSEINQKFNAVQDQILRGYRVIRTDLKAEEEQRITAAREALDDLRRQLKLLDIEFDVDDRIRRGDFSTTKKADDSMSDTVSAIKERIDEKRKQLRDMKKEAEAPAREAEREAKREAKRLNDLSERLSEVMKLYETQSRAVPGEQEDTDGQTAKVMKEKIAELRKLMSAEDVVFGLEDKLRRMDFAKPEKGAAKPLSEALAKIKAREKEVRGMISEEKRKIREAELESKKLEDAFAKLEEAKFLYKNKARALKEQKAEADSNATLESLRKQIADLEKLMDVEDSIFDLEDRIARQAPPTKKRREAESDALFSAHIKQRELRRELARIEESLMPKTLGGRLSEYAEALRTVKATADMSAAFRQAVFLMPRRPVKFTKAFAKAARAFFDSNYADRIDFEMRRQPGQVWRDRAGLYLSNIDSKMTNREEAFTSKLVDRVGLVKASNRNMVIMLNLMRTAAFDQFRKSHPDANTETLNAMARFINVSTGRGELRGFEGAARVLSKVAFSPRFVTSRIQLLGSPFWAYKTDRAVFKEVIKDWIAFTTSGMAVLTLASLAGADVGDDPERHTFGKIEFGPLVIDIWGGLQQPAALTVKAAAKAGQEAGAYELDRDINILDAALRFLAYKASPAVSTPYSFIFGETIVGEELSKPEAAMRALMPMTFETMREVWTETEDPAWTLTAGALSFLGVGVQTRTD